MTYKPKTVAEWFVHRAAKDGKYLTQMKLQKLVYIAHGWVLGLLDEPLITEGVEAWKWGPVIRSLYGEYARFGSDPIECDIDVPPNLDDDNVEDILESVWEVYGKQTAAELSAMTHREGTPWRAAYQEGFKRPIPKESIAEHYRELAESDDE